MASPAPRRTLQNYKGELTNSDFNVLNGNIYSQGQIYTDSTADANSEIVALDASYGGFRVGLSGSIGQNLTVGQNLTTGSLNAGGSTLGVTNVTSLNTTGNITSGTLNSGVSTLGNTNVANITSAGNVASSTLNVTGLSQLSTVNSTSLTATGNVTSGSLNSGNSTLGATSVASLNATGNVTSATLNSGTSTLGNTTASNLTSNGSTTTNTLNVNNTSTLQAVSATTLSTSGLATLNSLSTGNAIHTGTTQLNGVTTTNSTFISSNTTDSTSASSGSIQTAGGAGIAKNLFVGGSSNLQTVTVTDLNVTGNINQTGSNNSNINARNLTIADNILIENAGPNSTADSGEAGKIFQSANNTGSGDVVAGTPQNTFTVTSTGTATTFVLPAAATAIYTTAISLQGAWVKVLSGTGVNQTRYIKTYDPTTGTVTVFNTNDQATITPTPVPSIGLDIATPLDNTSVVGIYTQVYAMKVYRQSDNSFVFGYSNVVPNTGPLAQINSLANVKLANLNASNGVTTATVSPLTAGQGISVDGTNFNQGTITATTVNATNGTFTTLNGRPAASNPPPTTISINDNDTTTIVQIPGTINNGHWRVRVVSSVSVSVNECAKIAANSTYDIKELIQTSSYTNLTTFLARASLVPLNGGLGLKLTRPSSNGTGSPIVFTVTISQI